MSLLALRLLQLTFEVKHELQISLQKVWYAWPFLRVSRS